MSRSEVMVLQKDLAAQTARLAHIEEMIADLGVKFGGAFVELQTNVKRIVDEAKAEIAGLACKTSGGCRL